MYILGSQMTVDLSPTASGNVGTFAGTAEIYSAYLEIGSGRL
jgi:hypothetical protein